MSGMEALGAAAFAALEEEPSSDEDEEMVMKVGGDFMEFDSAHDAEDAKPSSQLSQQSDDTVPVPVVMWNKPIAPALQGPVDTPNAKDANKVAAWKKAFIASENSREANATAADMLYKEYKHKCAFGKKQEQALKAALKKSKGTKTLQAKLSKLEAQSVADKRIAEAEKKVVQQENDTLKDQLKSWNRFKKDTDRAHANAIKELQKQVDEARKKAASAEKARKTAEKAYAELVSNQKVIQFRVEQYKQENQNLSKKVSMYENAQLRIQQSEARIQQKEDAAVRRNQQKKENHQAQLARAYHSAGYRRGSKELNRLPYGFEDSSDESSGDEEYRRRKKKSKKTGKKPKAKKSAGKKHQRHQYSSSSLSSEESGTGTSNTEWESPKKKVKKIAKKTTSRRVSQDGDSMVNLPVPAISNVPQAHAMGSTQIRSTQDAHKPAYEPADDDCHGSSLHIEPDDENDDNVYASPPFAFTQRSDNQNTQSSGSN